jgi:hypothetical protein
VVLATAKSRVVNPKARVTSLSIDDGRNVAVDAVVGQELAITLRSIGPSIYSDPKISSAAVVYLGTSDDLLQTPGGPTQQFRFRASAPGLAIFSYDHLFGDSVASTVSDTVRVHLDQVAVRFTTVAVAHGGRW